VTLIAGFHAFGTPVLIGDFLITSGAERSGLRKKILLIADNFALAWTGHLIAANSVVESLQSSLDLNAVTCESVKAVLTAPTTSDLEGSRYQSSVGSSTPRGRTAYDGIAPTRMSCSSVPRCTTAGCFIGTCFGWPSGPS
jgi:hypothetical protein